MILFKSVTFPELFKRHSYSRSELQQIQFLTFRGYIKLPLPSSYVPLSCRHGRRHISFAPVATSKYKLLLLLRLGFGPVELRGLKLVSLQQRLFAIMLTKPLIQLRGFNFYRKNRAFWWNTLMISTTFFLRNCSGWFLILLLMKAHTTHSQR